MSNAWEHMEQPVVEGEDLSFEDRFSKRQIIETPRGDIETVDIYPTAPQKDEVPVLVGQGWGSTIETYEPVMKEWSELGRRAITVNHPRWGGGNEKDKKLPGEITGEYATTEMRKALNLLAVIEEKKIEKIDALAHSESAVNVALAAALEPEKFRNIIFVAPAGMIGKDTVLRLLNGFAGQTKGRPETLSAIPPVEPGGKGLAEIPVTENEIAIGKIAIKESAKYFGKNPMRAVREGWNLAHTDIYELLAYLHSKGIGMVVISGVDDPVFPMDRMQEAASEKNLGGIVDGFLSVRGGHGEIGAHPERYVVAADSMLSALEAKQAKGDA